MGGRKRLIDRQLARTVWISVAALHVSMYALREKRCRKDLSFTCVGLHVITPARIDRSFESSGRLKFCQMLPFARTSLHVHFGPQALTLHLCVRARQQTFGTLHMHEH